MLSRFSVGDLTVHRVVETVSHFMPALQMLPDLSVERLDENRAWLQPDSLDPDDVFKLWIQSYVVETPHHVILVDSCLGNNKPRPRAEWNMRTDDSYIRTLAAAGFSVADVDYVMCTHLHVDHVGWNTKLVNGAWVPTFPNARYVFDAAEHAFWATANQFKENPVYLDSVLPIVQAGHADLICDDYQIGDHLRILPTPGHTPGHVAFCFGLGRDDVVMSGDLIHVPLQARYPELSFVNDNDRILAAQTRRAFLERYCQTSTLCCMAHFPAPSAGRIERWGEGFRCEALNAPN